MKLYFNLFLSLILPVSALLVLLSVAYYLLSYNLNIAMKLGTLTGFLLGIAFSALISAVYLFVRTIKIKNHQKELDKELENASKNKPVAIAIDKTLLLLMDNELTFDVVIHSIVNQADVEISNKDLEKGIINIITPNQMINITITKLTAHTSQLHIKAKNYSNRLKQIIEFIKLKEHSFLQY